jgi:hypothetical protein
MIANNFTVRIDLLSKTIMPFDPAFQEMVNRYSAMFFLQIWQLNLSERCAKHAYIQLNVTENLNRIHPQQYSMDCTLRIISDADFTYDQRVICLCNPHDPQRELRSARFDPQTPDTVHL